MTYQEHPKVRSSRFGLFALAGMAVLLVAAFAFILVRPRTPSRASLELDRKLAQLRTDGVPLTAVEIGKALPDPAAEHDARLIFRPAFAWNPGDRRSTNIPIVGGGSFPKRNEPIHSEVMSELATYLTNSDALLSDIPMHLDGVWFSMGWSNGFTNLPRFPMIQVRQLAQVLAVKSFYEAEKQDAQKATDTLRAGFGLAGTLNADLLVSTMIRVAVLGMMCDASEQVVNRSMLTADHLLTIQQSINPALADDFAQAYIVERHMEMTILDPIRAVFDNGGVERAKLTVWGWFQWMSGHRKPVYRDEDYLLYLNILDARRATQSLSGLARLDHSERLNAEYKTNSYSFMADVVGTHWTKATRGAVEARAKLEATKAALAVERFRLAHKGELPDSLSALVPEYLPTLPRDPLDNQPLRFKKLALGYVVYSIGADGVDNGGIERASPAITNNYDVTFTVEH